MTRHSQIVTTGDVSIETYLDGENDGPDVVLLPSYGRDGGDDFDSLTAALAAAGHRVLRPQLRGIARSTGPMTGVIEGASHALFPEQPAVVATAVLGYLRTLA